MGELEYKNQLIIAEKDTFFKPIPIKIKYRVEIKPFFSWQKNNSKESALQVFLISSIGKGFFPKGMFELYKF
ncbi:hypothetical protein [Algoriphagus sp.]|uniref:hypothetical protein n=1 Tax=Algoriphagus sp. TaxID=1872435 RepID=UPI0025C56AFD|nr:hypothetical protein [Algoriphagus sp.]